MADRGGRGATENGGDGKGGPGMRKGGSGAGKGASGGGNLGTGDRNAGPGGGKGASGNGNAGPGGRNGSGAGQSSGGRPADESADEASVRAEAVSRLEGLRREIDAIDARIVALLNERAVLGRAIGHAKILAGWSGVRDPRREREVLLRVSMANGGPLAQADLLAIYRRLIAATRALEDDDRRGGEPAGESTLEGAGESTLEDGDARGPG